MRREFFVDLTMYAGTYEMPLIDERVMLRPWAHRPVKTDQMPCLVAFPTLHDAMTYGTSDG